MENFIIVKQAVKEFEAAMNQAGFRPSVTGGNRMSLFNIQNTVQEVAEAIAVVLGVEVTIIDENFIRVAATGSYKELIGKRIPSNCVFEKIIVDKLPKYIKESHQDADCKNCAGEGMCTELAAIGFPIINNGVLLGIIGINAFKEEQKRKLIENKESLMAFLDKISGLIAVNFSYYKTIQELQIQSEEINKIIDSFGNGILCIDKEGKIKYLNKKARALLEACNDSIINQDIENILENLNLSSTSNNQREVKVSIGKKKSSIIIKNNPVVLDNAMVSTIMEINRTADVVREAYNLLEGSKFISFDDIVGDSKSIKAVKEIARKVAKGSSTVLIRGESGTGKELFARAIHSESLRYSAPFITINCASIPENLLESELFGYEGGAFSGARKEGKLGKFELANGGTIFLDEIGDMPLHLQPKILRVLQERTFTKVGGKETISVDIRLIAATHRNLEDMIKSGGFREDLYYRLNVIPICIPALRERREDILPLSEYFLKKYCAKLEAGIKTFSQEIKELFIDYLWHGNIRELENVVEYLVNISKGSIIAAEDLPLNMKHNIDKDSINVPDMSMKKQVEEFEKNILRSMLNVYGSSTEAKLEIANKLDMNLSTLYRKLTKYGL